MAREGANYTLDWSLNASGTDVDHLSAAAAFRRRTGCSALSVYVARTTIIPSNTSVEDCVSFAQDELK